MASKKPLRILMLNYEFPPLGGGASPVSYEIAKGYVKLGHKVDVVTMHYKGLSKFEIKDGINIHRVGCLRSKKEMCTTPEMLSYVLSAKYFLNKHLRAHSYDINHTHFIIPTGIVALWAKKKFGLPYIITSHGSDVLGYNKRFDRIYPLLSKKWKEIIKEAKVLTTPSKFLQDEITRQTKEGRFVVIPNGIDPGKFKGLKKEKKILVVARLFPNKGVQDILDALKGLDMKGWTVDIVGDGPYRKFLENKARENGLKKVLKFHGWLDNNSAEMKSLYGHASIFISASYFESFGLTVLEAMQANCYIIVSDVPGHRSLGLYEENYFTPKHITQLSRRIYNLAMGNRKSRLSKLDKDLFWKTIINKYNRVIL